MLLRVLNIVGENQRIKLSSNIKKVISISFIYIILKYYKINDMILPSVLEILYLRLQITLWSVHIYISIISPKKMLHELVGVGLIQIGKNLVIL